MHSLSTQSGIKDLSDDGLITTNTCTPLHDNFLASSVPIYEVIPVISAVFI